MKENYLFQSQRIGFRNWQDQDIALLLQLNQNKDVMRYFPRLQTEVECTAFLRRMQQLYLDKGYTYFVAEQLENQAFMGFIGLAWQTFVSPFTPCVDIGWRLLPSFWGKGYATEGAKRCLEYGFKTLKLQNIKAVAPLVNQPSIRVMRKIGMREIGRFDHPALKDTRELEACICYETVGNDYY